MDFFSGIFPIIPLGAAAEIAIEVPPGFLQAIPSEILLGVPL